MTGNGIIKKEAHQQSLLSCARKPVFSNSEMTTLATFPSVIT
jgi:hypothetical protein